MAWSLQWAGLVGSPYKFHAGAWLKIQQDCVDDNGQLAHVRIELWFGTPNTVSVTGARAIWHASTARNGQIASGTLSPNFSGSNFSVAFGNADFYVPTTTNPNDYLDWHFDLEIDHMPSGWAGYTTVSQVNIDGYIPRVYTTPPTPPTPTPTAYARSDPDPNSTHMFIGAPRLYPANRALVMRRDRIFNPDGSYSLDTPPYPAGLTPMNLYPVDTGWQSFVQESGGVDKGNFLNGFVGGDRPLFYRYRDITLSISGLIKWSGASFKTTTWSGEPSSVTPIPLLRVPTDVAYNFTAFDTNHIYPTTYSGRGSNVVRVPGGWIRRAHIQEYLPLYYDSAGVICIYYEQGLDVSIQSNWNYQVFFNLPIGA